MDMAGTGSGFVEPRNLHRGLSVKLPLRLTQRHSVVHNSIVIPLLFLTLCFVGSSAGLAERIAMKKSTQKHVAI